MTMSPIAPRQDTDHETCLENAKAKDGITRDVASIRPERARSHGSSWPATDQQPFDHVRYHWPGDAGTLFL